MPRSHDPNTFAELYMQLLFQMSAKPKKLAIRASNPNVIRLEYYAFRRAWAAQRDKAFKQRDHETHAFAAENYATLSRYQATIQGDLVIFTNVGELIGDILVLDGDEANDTPAMSTPAMKQASEKEKSSGPQGKGVSLHDLFDDGRTPRTPAALKHSLLANLQMLKDYGHSDEVAKAEQDLNDFLIQHPDQI